MDNIFYIMGKVVIYAYVKYVDKCIVNVCGVFFLLFLLFYVRLRHFVLFVDAYHGVSFCVGLSVFVPSFVVGSNP